MSTARRCDECGAPLAARAPRCVQCDAAVPGAQAETAAPDDETSRGAWSLARWATVAYAIAQVGLLLASARLDAGPTRVFVVRVFLVAAVIGAVARVVWGRSRAGLRTTASLLGLGSLAALGFLLTGLVPRSALAAITLGTGGLWAGALAVATNRVGRGGRG